MIEVLKSLLKNHNIECDKEKLVKFEIFYQLLLEWNQKMNLTAITEPEEVVIKHFFDSITPSFYYSFLNQKIVDIGAGAGFPSIPLKICFPDLKMTLLDSLNKRLIFLNQVIQELHLKDIRCIHGRAEELGRNKDHRQGYDVALSRAVARLNVVSEYSLPLVKKGGVMIALKGMNGEEEVKEANKAIKILGGEMKELHTFELPLQYGQRNIIIINKTGSTPTQFPRKPGTPNREPII